MEVHVDGPGVVTMTIRLENVVEKYLAAKKLSAGTCKEHRSTVAKRVAWGKGVHVDQIGRAEGLAAGIGCVILGIQHPVLGKSLDCSKALADPQEGARSNCLCLEDDVTFGMKCGRLISCSQNTIDFIAMAKARCYHVLSKLRGCMEKRCVPT